MKRLILLLLIGAFYTGGLQAKGYKINVEIKGAKDSTIYLAVHFGGNKFSRDTAQLDKNGNATFSKDTPLAGGMYLLALDGSHILDFLISNDQDQSFSIMATKDMYTQTLHFKNSPENEAFADFTRFMLAYQTKDRNLMEMKKESGTDPTVASYVNDELKKNQTEFEQQISQIRQQFPQGILSSIASSMNTPTPPEPSISMGTPGRDSILYQHYYQFEKEHFWDNFNLTDKRMLNTPILIPAMDRYFDQILIKRADSIIPALDKFIARGAADPDMYKFFVGHLFNLFMQSDIMGMETVVIHIIDNYYLAGKIKDTDEKFMKEITDYATKNRPTLIGKKAANLKMQTINGQYESLYDIDSPYTIVYFFEPSCGHCKQETPKVYKVYEKYRNKGLSGYSVYSQSNKEEWVEYVVKNNLQWINVWDPSNENDFRHKFSIYLVPQLYLLDKDKVIIGRRLNAESLDKLLDNLINKKK